MANVVRIRVEVKKKYNDPRLNVREALHDLRRKINQSGLMRDFKESQVFESKSQKRRKSQNASKKSQQMETIKTKILMGETIRASTGMVKKAKAELRKEKNEKKKDKKNHKYSEE